MVELWAKPAVRHRHVVRARHIRLTVLGTALVLRVFLVYIIYNLYSSEFLSAKFASLPGTCLQTIKHRCDHLRGKRDVALSLDHRLTLAKNELHDSIQSFCAHWRCPFCGDKHPGKAGDGISISPGHVGQRDGEIILEIPRTRRRCAFSRCRQKCPAQVLYLPD